VIRLVHELAAQVFPFAVSNRVLNVAPSTSYEAIKLELSARAVGDQDLIGLIREVNLDPRGTYGAPLSRASSFLADRLRDDRFLLKGADHDGKTTGYSV